VLSQKLKDEQAEKFLKQINFGLEFEKIKWYFRAKS
jgi:hypothetical protein